MNVSVQYPHLQFIYQNETYKRYHALKFNQDVDDFIYKDLTDNTAYYTIDSLRLAFGRITSD